MQSGIGRSPNKWYIEKLLLMMGKQMTYANCYAPVTDWSGSRRCLLWIIFTLLQGQWLCVCMCTPVNPAFARQANYLVTLLEPSDSKRCNLIEQRALYEWNNSRSLIPNFHINYFSGSLSPLDISLSQHRTPPERQQPKYSTIFKVAELIISILISAFVLPRCWQNTDKADEITRTAFIALNLEINCACSGSQNYTFYFVLPQKSKK